MAIRVGGSVLVSCAVALVVWRLSASDQPELPDDIVGYPSFASFDYRPQLLAHRLIIWVVPLVAAFLYWLSGRVGPLREPVPGSNARRIVGLHVTAEPVAEMASARAPGAAGCRDRHRCPVPRCRADPGAEPDGGGRRRRLCRAGPGCHDGVGDARGTDRPPQLVLEDERRRSHGRGGGRSGFLCATQRHGRHGRSVPGVAMVPVVVLGHRRDRRCRAGRLVARARRRPRGCRAPCGDRSGRVGPGLPAGCLDGWGRSEDQRVRRHAHVGRRRPVDSRLLPLERRALHPWSLRGRAAHEPRLRHVRAHRLGVEGRLTLVWVPLLWVGYYLLLVWAAPRRWVLQLAFIAAVPWANDWIPISVRWFAVGFVFLLLGSAIRRGTRQSTVALTVVLFVGAILVPEMSFQVIAVAAVLVICDLTEREAGTSRWTALGRTRVFAVTGIALTLAWVVFLTMMGALVDWIEYYLVFGSGHSATGTLPLDLIDTGMLRQSVLRQRTRRPRRDLGMSRTAREPAPIHSAAVGALQQRDPGRPLRRKGARSLRPLPHRSSPDCRGAAVDPAPCRGHRPDRVEDRRDQSLADSPGSPYRCGTRSPPHWCW